mmetsp:Transcript_143391/g.363977  ORF Transcript_143391/g.363977 Transcript_143391/m.363977 type:complete len:219 (+) Transcript_143391:181-837(+)
MVRLQLWLYTRHAGQSPGHYGRTGGHEHHAVGSVMWLGGADAPLRNLEEVRHWRHVQRHLGRPRLDHRSLRQRGVRLGRAYRHHRCLHLPGLLHAPSEVEGRRPHRRLRRAWCLRRLGCAGRRPVRLGHRLRLLQRLERMGLRGRGQRLQIGCLGGSLRGKRHGDFHHRRLDRGLLTPRLRAAPSWRVLARRRRDAGERYGRCQALPPEGLHDGCHGG